MGFVHWNHFLGENVKKRHLRKKLNSKEKYRKHKIKQNIRYTRRAKIIGAGVTRFSQTSNLSKLNSHRVLKH